MTQKTQKKTPGEADRFRRGQEPLGHHRPELRGHHRDHGAGTGERQAAGPRGFSMGFWMDILWDLMIYLLGFHRFLNGILVELTGFFEDFRWIWMRFFGIRFFLMRIERILHGLLVDFAIGSDRRGWWSRPREPPWRSTGPTPSNLHRTPLWW